MTPCLSGKTWYSSNYRARIYTFVERPTCRLLRRTDFCNRRRRFTLSGRNVAERLLDSRMERRLQRAVKILSAQEGSKRLCKEAGIDVASASLDTIQRTLHRMVYSFLQCRRKGLLTDKDRLKRMRFARSQAACCVKFTLWVSNSRCATHRPTEWSQNGSVIVILWLNRSSATQSGKKHER